MRHADYPWCDPERDRGPCEECGGSGKIYAEFDYPRFTIPCWKCEGHGRWLCPACVASSEVEREEARRIYEGTPKPLDASYGTPAEQMRDAGRGHLVREDE
jgi:DnaJ-class molecular chaperone